MLTKQQARDKLNNSLKAGTIVRPDYCGECGIECTPDGHHWSWDRPLDVKWLCRKCHRLEDKVDAQYAKSLLEWSSTMAWKQQLRMT